MSDRVTRSKARQLTLDIANSLTQDRNATEKKPVVGGISLQTAVNLQIGGPQTRVHFHETDCFYWRLMGNKRILLTNGEVWDHLLVHYKNQYPRMGNRVHNGLVREAIDKSSAVGYYLTEQRKMFTEILRDQARKCECGISKRFKKIAKVEAPASASAPAPPSASASASSAKTVLPAAKKVKFETGAAREMPVVPFAAIAGAVVMNRIQTRSRSIVTIERI